MSKNKKPAAPQSQEDFESALKSEVQVFDSVAVGVIPRKEGGFNIIKITVDSKGLEAGEVIVLDTAETKWEATEKFKIYVVKQGVI